MKREDRGYIEHRMIRARETLGEAGHLLDGGYTAGVINRLYYACFYAITALLLSEGRSSSKHSGVMSMFDQFWVKPRRVSPEMGAFYHLLFDRRQKGDYEDVFAFNRTDLDDWLREAEVFVEEVSGLITAPPEC
jgi:uncharacterized protein